MVQTDTTVGFLCADDERLAQIKKRDPKKPFLISVSSFEKLKKITRVPKAHKNLVRKSQKRTFVYPNKKAVRVVNSSVHKKFLDNFDYIYSTSANESGKPFSLLYAKDKADIIVEDKRGFFEGEASEILLLLKSKKRRIR